MAFGKKMMMPTTTRCRTPSPTKLRLHHHRQSSSSSSSSPKSSSSSPTAALARAAAAGRGATLPSLLGVLIVFSVATNLLLWTGSGGGGRGTYRATHYGLGEGGGGGSSSQAWSPTITSRDDDGGTTTTGERRGRRRRVFRDGKSSKKKGRGGAKDATVGRGDEIETMGDDRAGYGDGRGGSASGYRPPRRDDDDGRVAHRVGGNFVPSGPAAALSEGAGRRRRDEDDGSRTKKGEVDDGDRHARDAAEGGGEGPDGERDGRVRRRRDSPRSKTKEEGVDAHARERRDDSKRPRLRPFGPHPARKGGRRGQPPSWRSSPPAPSSASIEVDGVVFLDGIGEGFSDPRREGARLEEGWLARNVEEEGADESEEEKEDLSLRSQTAVWEEEDGECVPMSEWQTTSHPTCNAIHEMDISLLLHDSAFSLVSSKGFWRNAWKVDVSMARAGGGGRVGSSDPAAATEPSEADAGAAATHHAVMKSLKYIHEPNEEVFELSRVDAVSLDVLTRSRFTIDIYGFCGSSSIQEFAGGDLKGLLPKLDPLDRLRMASQVAEGVADIHAVDSPDNGGVGRRRVPSDNPTSTAEGDAGNKTDVVSMIHNDINMDNVLLGYRGGVETPILNDFNIAVFRKKHALTGKPCRFRGRFANPQWMSPEQQERPGDELSTRFLDEKIDVYALGNIMYKIAVGNSPWKYEYKTVRITPDLKAKIARAKLRGGKPKVPPEIRNSTDPSLRAILTAMDRCYRNDAELRPSARELAAYLKSELAAAMLPSNSTDSVDLG